MQRDRRLKPSILAGALALGLAAAAALPAAAQQKAPDDLVKALPAEIPEVISGGGWQDGKDAGVYRGVVVMTNTATGPEARVFIQWIGLKAEGGTPTVVRSLPIKDVTDKKLQNAQLGLEADKDDEAIFVVTWYDMKSQKPGAIAFKAGKPGQVQPTDVPGVVGGPAPKQ